VGGGNRQDSSHVFSRFAQRVTIVLRGCSLKCTLSKYCSTDRGGLDIEVMPNTEVAAIDGRDTLEQVL